MSMWELRLFVKPRNPKTTVKERAAWKSAEGKERRMDFIKLVKSEVEQTKVAIRNIRRDANTKAKELVKNKEISEDEEKNNNDQIQKLTDLHIGNIDEILKDKEADLMQV